MCSILEDYASTINAVANDTEDLVPTVLFFNTTGCNGSFEPQSGGTFVSNPYNQGQSIAIPITPFRSFFIPFNFANVTFTSVGGLQASFVGPYFSSDNSTLAWQTGDRKTWVEDPPASITFDTVNNWESDNLVSQCMGKLQFIGEFSLTRYQPQTDRCDEFMTNTWCPANINNTECACFKELPAIEEKSKRLGVNLPVICFGEGCATENSYKTLGFLNQPCNLTVCQQIVNETPGVIDEGQDTVFCGGQFFNSSANVVQPTITVIPPNAPTSNDEAPFYVWIMLGVSGILFFVLIYLLFAQPPRKKKSILNEIKTIKAFKKMKSSANRPGTIL